MPETTHHNDNTENHRDNLLNHARHALKYGINDCAKAYKEVLVQYPDDIEANATLTHIKLCQVGHKDEIDPLDLKNMEKIINRVPAKTFYIQWTDNLTLFYELAERCIQYGFFINALRLLNKCDPEQDASNLLAECYKQSNNFSKAAPLLEDKNNQPRIFDLIFLQLMQNKIIDAENTIEFHSKSHPFVFFRQYITTLKKNSGCEMTALFATHFAKNEPSFFLFETLLLCLHGLLKVKFYSEARKYMGEILADMKRNKPRKFDEFVTLRINKLFNLKYLCENHQWKEGSSIVQDAITHLLNSLDPELKKDFQPQIDYYENRCKDLYATRFGSSLYKNKNEFKYFPASAIDEVRFSL